jgi:FtsP/CotA-like multicopper oxidase with cupredoxin domain
MAASDFVLNRRRFLAGTGAVAAVAGGWPGRLLAQGAEPVDHTIRIAPLSLELAPGRTVKTFGYNGTAPGPTLRLQQGKPVSIKVVNDTDQDDLVHWHGLFNAPEQDGSMEEGSPMIGKGGGSLIYRFAPEPAGTRWYHSHARADKDLTRSTYSGMFGFLIVEPSQDPGAYDREVLLAAHHWEGNWVSMQDLRPGPPPDNGLEVMYEGASFNDRMLGHGEPVRVREGERVLFRLLNASATENIKVALPGHRFTVLALDGNPVPTQQTVDVVTLGVAERADVIVEMNRPGVWIMGDTAASNRKLGLGVVVEYAGHGGEPQWSDPPKSDWDYTAFGNVQPAAVEPDTILKLLIEKIPGGRGGYNRWTINGKSWPDTDPMLTIERGKRYRLVMDNRSGDTHPMHLHRHTFELTDINGKPTSGVMKDTVNMVRYTTATVDFVADKPGATLFHCHHQDHMDEGLMGLIRYA